MSGPEHPKAPKGMSVIILRQDAPVYLSIAGSDGGFWKLDASTIRFRAPAFIQLNIDLVKSHNEKPKDGI